MWIETRRHSLHWRLSWVTPCVGVWIETGNDRQLCGRIVSHPAWVCGLKLSSVYSCIYIYCHTLRGCVDWNFAYLQGYRREGSHTLRGCVDWNQKNTGYLDNREVTPCVGVWIETIPLGDILSHYGVTPCVGVYGLKHCSLVGQVYGRIVSIRPLVYFSSSCYKVKSQTKYVRLLTLLWLEKTRTIPDAYLLSVFFCGFT